MHRFYAEQTEEGYAFSPEDARHALRVLRLKDGAEVEIVAGGVRWQATLEVRGDRVFARLGDRLPDTEAKLRVTLYQGLPKADKMDLIIRMATELGAAAIQPVAMDRSVVRLDGKDEGRRRERWEKIAREAVKQCGRVCPPEIRGTKPLSALCGEMQALDLLLIPWEEATGGESIGQQVRVALSGGATSVGILIGPEGGIDAEEISWLCANTNTKTVTLGPRILRTETAGPVALALVMGFAGEME